MSDSFSHTKESIRRLSNNLKSADEDTRWAFAYWSIGSAMLGYAIIVQFGWVGAMFCAGLALRGIGNQMLERS